MSERQKTEGDELRFQWFGCIALFILLMLPVYSIGSIAVDTFLLKRKVSKVLVDSPHPESVRDLLGEEKKIYKAPEEFPEWMKDQYPDELSDLQVIHQWNVEGLPYFFVFLGKDETGEVVWSNLK